MSEQLQFSEPVQGAVDPAAGEAAKADGMALAQANTPDEWADAALAGFYERLGPPDLDAGCDRLLQAIRDEQQRGGERA